MNRWQKRHLSSNKHKLVSTTRCNELLLGRLEAAGVLGKADCESIRCTSNQFDQAQILYDTVETRRYGYELLSLALAECRQTGSFDILMKGLAEHWISQFATQPTTAQNFIHSEKGKQLVDKVTCHMSPEEYINLISETSSASNFEELKLVRNTIPSDIPYYIPRYLTKRIIVDKGLFAVECPDIFVFKDIGHFDLTHLINLQRSASSSSQLDDGLTCRFIRLDEEVDWKEICALANKIPVHLIKFEQHDKSCVLEETRGNSEILSRFLTRKKERGAGAIACTEDDFIGNFMEEPKSTGFCICDYPGMGKTRLLTSLAKKIAQRCPERIVAFIKLSDFIGKIAKESQELTLEVILKELCTSSMSRCILQELFDADMAHLVLFLDGFDEVHPSLIEFALTTLSNLVTNLPKTKICISSRPHLRQDLEECLGALSFDILPFRKANKIDFLLDFWKRSIGGNVTKLLEFAHFCVKEYRSCWKKEGCDMTGIPLYCQLLAEVYSRDAERYSKSTRNINLKDFCKFERSLPQLYKEYMRLCIDKCSQLLNNPGDILKVKEYHVWIALKTTFPTFADVYSSQFGVTTTASKVAQSAISAGMLEMRSSSDNTQTVEFIHRTSAEYLSAQFFANVLQAQQHSGWTAGFTKSAVEFLFKTVLETGPMPSFLSAYDHRLKMFFHADIVYFLNSGLMESCTLSQHHLYQVAYSSLNAGSDQFYALIFSCLRHNYSHIFNLVNNIAMVGGVGNNHEFLVPQEKIIFLLVDIAGTFSTVANLEKLAMTFLNCFNVDIWAVCNDIKDADFFAIRHSASKGDYEMVRYLLDKVSVNLIDILECCILRSSNDPASVVDSKLDICKLLLSKTENLFSDAAQMNLQYYPIHLKLMKWLIAHEKNLLGSFLGQNVVHHAIDYMSAGELGQLCCFFIERCQKLKIPKEQEWKSVLRHILLKRKDTKLDTIEMILKACGDGDHNDFFNELMLIAFATKQTQDIIDYFLRHTQHNASCELPDGNTGSNTSFHVMSTANQVSSMLDDSGNTFLHIAAKHFNPDDFHNIVKFAYLSEHKAIFIVKNGNSDLPIHLAVAYMELETSTLQLFAQNGVDINCQDKEGLAVLGRAARGKRSFNFLKNLIEMGANIDLKDKYGNTFVHQICKFYTAEEYHEIVHYLSVSGRSASFRNVNFRGETVLYSAIENLQLSCKTLDILVSGMGPGDVNKTDTDGNSALFVAVERARDLQLVQHLVNLGADWSVKNKFGRNLAHASASSGSIEHLKYFVALGCGVNDVDIHGDSVLHRAARFPTFNLLEIVQFLVTMGADKEKKNLFGNTAGMMLLDYGRNNRKILDILCSEE